MTYSTNLREQTLREYVWIVILLMKLLSRTTISYLGLMTYSINLREHMFSPRLTIDLDIIN
jgi:hypothetical protein